MKLVVKLPDGKPPFIGIEFENPWKGESDGREVSMNLNSSLFTLVIQPIGQNLSIRLVCDDPVKVKFYSNIKFDKERFMRWYAIAKAHKILKFGLTHSTYSEDKICFMVKDGKKVPMVLTIRALLMEGEGF